MRLSKMRFAWLRPAAIAILAACGGGGDPVATPNTGSIRGSVTDNTGATVANASVELAGNGQAPRMTNTGNDGTYAFADVLPGTYTLAVTPPTGFTLVGTGTSSITVTARAEVSASPFILDPVNYGSIRGIVTDDAGASVANAGVALTGNGQAIRTTTSGADGSYTFANVPPGTYYVTVTPPNGFIDGSGTAAVTVAGGAEANASAFVLFSCALARPNFGGPASEADRALFAYDVNAPLNLQSTVLSTNNGVQVSSITYTSPGGGSVPGILVVPLERTGLLPAVVAMHPSGFSTQPWVPYLEILGQKGAVVIAIDAPYFRRGGMPILRFTASDYDEQIQLIKDLQRAIDVLLATGKVDAARIGFEGYSYGGIVGAQFVGIERRLKAAVLTAAHGGQVTGATNQTNLAFLGNLSCATRTAWLRAMAPIEAIRFIPHASPTALFFQIARFDTAVLPADAQALYDAAPNPKEVKYYDTGHGLNLQAQMDKQAWLHQQLGIDP